METVAIARITVLYTMGMKMKMKIILQSRRRVSMVVLYTVIHDDNSWGIDN